MKSKICVFKVSDREWEKLDYLVKDDGGTMAEFFRKLIKEEYDRVLPPYKRAVKVMLDSEGDGLEKEKPVPLTPEQKCELAGGRLEKQGFKTVCVLKYGKGELTSELFAIDESIASCEAFNNRNK